LDSREDLSGSIVSVVPYDEVKKGGKVVEPSEIGLFFNCLVFETGADVFRDFFFLRFTFFDGL